MASRGAPWTKEMREEYNRLHKKAQYHRVSLDIPRTDLDLIRAAADQDGLQLSPWLRSLIYRRMEELGIKLPPKETQSHEEILKQIHAGEEG